jgi:peptide/nickel transport system ATP-binding protein
LLKINNVKKTYKVRKKGSFTDYNEVKAIRGVTLQIREGENFGIVGESGCGKSTLTRLLTWLEEPDQGSIEFQGKDLGSLTKRELVQMRCSFQLLLQDPYGSLPPQMPVGRIIAESLLIHKVCPRSEIRERVLTAMNEVGLDPEVENQLTVGLSAGQRQRVNIARALVLEPKLLILDETLSALDQIEQARLLDLFDSLQRNHGFTYVFISHDMALVRKVCHRIAVMYLGRIIELADNKTLFENPGHPYSRALLSAVPSLDDHPFKVEDCLLEGEPPSPVYIPNGCSFRSRCPDAITDCYSHDPETLPWSDEGHIACHLINIA